MLDLDTTSVNVKARMQDDDTTSYKCLSILGLHNAT